ncbi:MAG: hypothetical protein K0M40_11960 [Prolixibacteraceae bacterium]|nr:hypothetical protein [Prolixibacteraceae bacterium]
MEAKYKIGYIDEDINQVKKYQRRFRKYGFEVIGYDFDNKMSLEDLMEQVFKSDIDLLMIDYKLNETNKVTFNGEEVESYFYDKKPLFPHIVFTNKVDQAEPHVEDWKIIFDKDDIFSEDENDEIKVQHFITTLERSIEQYRKHIQRRKEEISNLLEKGKVEKLNPTEKHTLLKLQKELKVLDNTYQEEVPEYLMISQNITESQNLKNEAEELLQKLIEKRKKQ